MSNDSDFRGIVALFEKIKLDVSCQRIFAANADAVWDLDYE